MIQDGKVGTPEVKVVVGQRVYFAIVTGPGLSITDRRLVVDLDHCGETKRKAA